MVETNREFFIKPDDPPSKRAILNAAFKLFVRDGYDATNIRVIAKEAGYSNPALFKFFKSKEDLGLYLFECCYERYVDIFESSIRAGRSFDENLEDTIDRVSSVINENPGTLLFVQDHLRHFWPRVSTRVRLRSILAEVQRLVEQGISEKAIGKDANPKVLVAAFVGFLVQFARMFYFGEFKGGIDAWKDQLSTVSRRLLAA
jgi:AcrR family transcriptional regulator